MSLPRRSRLINNDGLPNAYLRPVNAEPTILVTSADYPSDIDLDLSRENVILRVTESSRSRRMTGTLLALEASEKLNSTENLKVTGQLLGYRKRKPAVSALISVNPFTVPTNWIVPKKRIEETVANFLRENSEETHLPRVIRLYLGLEEQIYAQEGWRKRMLDENKVNFVSPHDKIIDWLRFGHQ